MTGAPPRPRRRSHLAPVPTWSWWRSPRSRPTPATWPGSAPRPAAASTWWSRWVSAWRTAATSGGPAFDYWEHVDVRTWKSLDALLETEPGGRFLYSSRVHRPYTRAAHSPGDWLLFGCETRGLPEPLLARFADRTYTIPMWVPVRSLNLSTSVGIVVYEALRQIHGFGPDGVPNPCGPCRRC